MVYRANAIEEVCQSNGTRQLICFVEQMLMEEVCRSQWDEAINML
jgi:hypothetical protein